MMIFSYKTGKADKNNSQMDKNGSIIFCMFKEL